MWVKADDGSHIMYLPLATTSFKKITSTGSRFFGKGVLTGNTFAVDEKGRKQNSLPAGDWNFIEAEIVEYTEVP